MNEPDANNIPQTIDWKPVFFSSNTSPELRKAYARFIILCIIALIAIIWPAALLFNRGDILIFGLPVNLFWVVMWKGIIFIGLILLYRFEYLRKPRLKQ